MKKTSGIDKTHDFGQSVAPVDLVKGLIKVLEKEATYDTKKLEIERLIGDRRLDRVKREMMKNNVVYHLICNELNEQLVLDKDGGGQDLCRKILCCGTCIPSCCLGLTETSQNGGSVIYELLVTAFKNMKSKPKLDKWTDFIVSVVEGHMTQMDASQCVMALNKRTRTSSQMSPLSCVLDVLHDCPNAVKGNVLSIARCLVLCGAHVPTTYSARGEPLNALLDEVRHSVLEDPTCRLSGVKRHLRRNSIIVGEDNGVEVKGTKRLVKLINHAGAEEDENVAKMLEMSQRETFFVNPAIVMCKALKSMIVLKIDESDFMINIQNALEAEGNVLLKDAFESPLKVMEHLARAIDTLHKANLVHNMVVPKNVYLIRGADQSVAAKLCCFSRVTEVDLEGIWSIDEDEINMMAPEMKKLIYNRRSGDMRKPTTNIPTFKVDYFGVGVIWGVLLIKSKVQMMKTLLTDLSNLGTNDGIFCLNYLDEDPDARPDLGHFLYPTVSTTIATTGLERKQKQNLSE